MLTAHGLSKNYSGVHKVDAVNNLSLSIQEGEFVAIVGRSGSGKSTLLGMLGGLCRPTSGAVEISGVNQWSLPADLHASFRNQKVGYVFQFASLLPSLRAIDNVSLPALIHGSEPESIVYTRARLLLEEVGLGQRYDFYPNELSGGEQRRVAIARALINAPDVVLADEPTADLDEQTEAEILNLLIDIQRERGITLVVVTHNQSVAARADRVLTMSNGQIVASEAPVRTAHQPESRPSVAVSKTVSKTTQVSLGSGFDAFVGKLVILSLPLIALFWCINMGISYYEQVLLAQQSAAHEELEDLAMRGLRAEVKDIVSKSDGEYQVVLYLRNTDDTKPIYVLSPTVRGFVQVGTNWIEAPMESAEGDNKTVHKVLGERLIKFNFRPNVPGYSQLIPYYMHIRFSNEMLISASSQPKSELIERADNYYVYLKPHDANDRAILSKLKCPGKPPVWITMPPH